MLAACILTPPLRVQGTVYEKTNAEMEMKKINREEFWEQAKVGAELVVQSGSLDYWLVYVCVITQLSRLRALFKHYSLNSSQLNCNNAA